MRRIVYLRFGRVDIFHQFMSVGGKCTARRMCVCVSGVWWLLPEHVKKKPRIWCCDNNTGEKRKPFVQNVDFDHLQSEAVETRAPKKKARRPAQVPEA